MRARIGEEEPADDALAKLRDTLELHVPDAEERAWLEPRLAHLLGLGEATTRRPAGAVLRLAGLLRAARRAGAVRARVRGPPVGRARPARLHRPRARVVAEAPAVRGRSLATRDDDGARRRVAQRDGACARAAQRRGDGCAARRIRAGAARRAPRGDPRPRRGRSALRGRDGADAARPRPARAQRRHVPPDGPDRGARGARDAARAARGTPRRADPRGALARSRRIRARQDLHEAGRRRTLGEGRGRDRGAPPRPRPQGGTHPPGGRALAGARPVRVPPGPAEAGRLRDALEGRPQDTPPGGRAGTSRRPGRTSRRSSRSSPPTTSRPTG